MDSSHIPENVKTVGVPPDRLMIEFRGASV